MDNNENEVVKIQEVEPAQTFSVEKDATENHESKSVGNVKEKIEELFKSAAIKSKKTTFLILGVVALFVAFVVGVNLATNNYKTPIKTIEKYANAEEYTLQDYVIDYDGGLAKKQIKKMFKILRNSDDFLDAEEEFYDSSVWKYENRLDEYGDDFVITYNIIGREELTKADLRDKRKELQEYVYGLEAIVDETEEFGASDWGEMAEELGFMKVDAKKLIKSMQDLANEYGRIEVSKGYIVSVGMTITGAELDEPLEEEIEINVYKVNGRWIGEAFGIDDILSDIY